MSDLSPVHSRRNNFIFGGVLLAALLAIGSAPYVIKTSSYVVQQQVVKPLFEYDGCDVSGLSDKNHPMFDVTSIDIAKKIIQEYGIRCEENAHFYVSITDGAINKIPGNVLLAKCIESTSHEDSCVSYQYNRW